MQGLPVKNRNFMALVQLVPGATEALEGNQNTLGRTQPLNISVHGQRHFDNNIRLDGVGIIADSPMEARSSLHSNLSRK